MIVGSLEIQLMAGIARLQRDMNAGRQVVSNATASMERAANAAKAALASIGAGLVGGAGLSQLVRMTDEYTKFTAQLKLGTNSQKEYARAMEDVKRISTAAQNDMGTTGVLYARIIASTRDLGVTQVQVAKVTETINLALAATGAGATESASAMLQLSQAFGSGVLRGEEFNAVYEAAPELLRILARNLDIPIGRLRKLAEEGKLTSDKLVAAFSNDQVINQLRENVAQITTFSGAMTVFRNNLMEVVGTQLHASGAVAAVTSAILAGAGAIKTMIDVLATAAKIGAAYFALFVVAPPLITATAAAMTRLGHAMAVYAMNVMIGQANTIKFNQALFGTSVAAGLASGAITRVGLALNSVFALYAGWQIGKYLNDQFVEVEVAGEIMAGALLEGWEMLKFGAKVAFDGMTVFAREAIAKIADAYGTWFEFAAKGFRLIGDDRMADAVVAYADKIRTATAVSGTFAGRTAEARAEMEKNIKVIEQDTDRRIAAAFAADREGVKLTASAEARVKAGEAVTGMTEEQKKAYESAVKGANDYIESLKRERQELGLDDDQLRMLNASRAAALAPTAALRREIMEIALALTVEKQAIDSAKLGREQYEAAIKAEADARAQEQSSLQDSIDRMQQEIDTYGMGAAAITRYNLAKLEARRADLIAANNYGTEMLAVMDSIDKLTQLEGLQNVRDDLDSLFETGRVETFGQALRDAFGNAGSALGALTGAFKDYSDKQDAAEMARAKVRLKYGDDEKRIAREVGKINAVEERDRVSAYADMAGAAKGFFKENSTGYRVMEAAERTYRAIELANQMQSLYTHLFVTTTKATATATGQGVETAAVVAGEAARNTAKVPGVFMAFMSALGPWGMAAAAVAIAAVLGGAFGGGGGSVSLTQQRQERQGTGTVLGSDAKSESISRALDAIEGATLQGLGISNGMLTSLRNIEAGIGQFASLLVRTTGVTGDFGAGLAGGGFDKKGINSLGAIGGGLAGGLAGGAVAGAMTMGVTGATSLTALGAVAGPIGMAIGAVLGAVLGKTLGKVTTAIFGGKKSVEDTGFTIDPISFQGIQNGGLSSMQYADIKTSGGWFGKDKSNTALEGLGLEGNRQIANVLMSLYDTVFQAGGMLEIGADGFAAQLNSFVVDIGKVSLKGLSDDEIQKELSAVFSKVGDDLAKFGVGGLEQFQKVGEGYLETLTRVATNYQAVSVVTDSLGMTFGAMGLASVGARERLIDLVGGLDEFTSSADQFLSDFYTDQERANSLRARITPTLDQFGIKTGSEDSLKQFRSVVTGLDLTTEAGARAYATLMQIAPAFKQIYDVDAGALEKATDLARTQRELEIQIMELTGDKAGALAASRALEMEKAEAALRPALVRIHALQDEAVALELANSKRSQEAQILEMLGDKSGALAIRRELELAAMEPALRGQAQRIHALQDEASVLQLANSKRGQEAQILEMLGDKSAALAIRRELELAGMDATMRAGQLRIHALQDEAAALATSNSLLDIQARIYEVTGNKAGAAAVLVQQQAAALVAMDPALRSATQSLWAVQAAEKSRADSLSEAKSVLDLQAQMYEANGNKAAAAAVLLKQHELSLIGLTPAVAAATKATWAAQTAAKAQQETAAEQSAILNQLATAYEVSGNGAALALVQEKQRAASLVGLSEALVAATMLVWEAQAKAKTDSLVLELISAEGRAYEALSIQRRNELALLSETDQAVKRATFAAQDRAKLAALEIELLGAQGKGLQALAQQRMAELAQLSPAEAAIKKAMYAAQDMAKTDALTLELLEAQGNMQEVVNRQRAAELAQLSATDAAIKKATYAAQDLAKELGTRTPEQRGLDAMQTVIDNAEKAWRDIGTSLLEEVDRIRGVMRASTAVDLADAQLQFTIASAQARAGDFNAAQALPELSRALLEMAEQEAVNRRELLMIQATTAASLQATTGFAASIKFRDPHAASASVRPVQSVTNWGKRQSETAVNNESALLDELRAMREELRVIKESSRKHADMYEQQTEGGNAARVVIVDE